MSELDDIALVGASIKLTADNNRDKLKEITNKLEAGIKGIFDSEQYKIYLNTLSKFYNYSFGNCVLIAMQKPEATHIAGYVAWQRNFKRHVIKGEKGIKIIAPSSYKTTKLLERIDPKSGGVVMNKDGDPQMDEVEITIPSYRVANVFDISQTDGDPLPEIGVNELTGTAERYKDFYGALEKLSPVPITIENITSGAKGYYSHTENYIAIKENMSEIQTLKTFIHEIAHARLHSVDKNEPKGVSDSSHRSKEVEAESVAYTVCQHYGLDTADYSFGYIAGWSGNKNLDILKESLETIRNESADIITKIDEYMDQLAKDRELKIMSKLDAELETSLLKSSDNDKITGISTEIPIEIRKDTRKNNKKYKPTFSKASKVSPAKQKKRQSQQQRKNGGLHR